MSKNVKSIKQKIKARQGKVDKHESKIKALKKSLKKAA